jgi:hypothetical protein
MYLEKKTSIIRYCVIKKGMMDTILNLGINNAAVLSFATDTRQRQRRAGGTSGMPVFASWKNFSDLVLGAFAGGGADAAGELGEVVGLAQAFVGLLPESAIDEVVELGEEVVEGAARRHAADEASGVAEGDAAIHGQHSRMDGILVIKRKNLFGGECLYNEVKRNILNRGENLPHNAFKTGNVVFVLHVIGLLDRPCHSSA